jgi:ABC-type antimicrobial peptide transport system permease subunit
MCSNLAGLLLSRGLNRQQEYAIRMALGATRVDVLRHAVAEILVISVFGGVVTVILTGWLTQLSSAILSLGIPVGAPSLASFCRETPQEQHFYCDFGLV